MRSGRPYWATSSTPPAGMRGSTSAADSTAKWECTGWPMPSCCVVQCSTPGRTSFIGGRDLLGGRWPRVRYRGGPRVPAPATSIALLSTSDVDQALALYASGFFPMDDPDEEPFGPLPFYAAEDRCVFELDERCRAAVRRRVRRSLRAGRDWACGSTPASTPSSRAARGRAR